jgi:hypothetical protein
MIMVVICLAATTSMPELEQAPIEVVRRLLNKSMDSEEDNQYNYDGVESPSTNMTLSEDEFDITIIEQLRDNFVNR